MTLCSYVLVEYFVATNILGRTSVIFICWYGYFHDYIVPFHFQHNIFPCFFTYGCIQVRNIISCIFLICLYFFIMELTLSIFPTHSLVEDYSICNVFMCFHPMITAWNFTNGSSWISLVKKSASMCYVLKYSIDMLLLSIWSFKKNVYPCSLSSWGMISYHFSPVSSHLG